MLAALWTGAQLAGAYREGRRAGVCSAAASESLLALGDRTVRSDTGLFLCSQGSRRFRPRGANAPQAGVEGFWGWWARSIRMSRWCAAGHRHGEGNVSLKKLPAVHERTDGSRQRITSNRWRTLRILASRDCGLPRQINATLSAPLTPVRTAPSAALILSSTASKARPSEARSTARVALFWISSRSLA